MRLLLTAFIVGILVSSLQPAAAGPSEHLIFGPKLSAADCNTAGAKLVVNVIQKIINDVDSGTAGNDWAVDEYTRQIRVWQVDTTTFCAALKYIGSFVTVIGASPGASDDDSNDTVAAGVTGTFEGGYRSSVFTGTLKGSPDYRTRGNIGTFNYGCVPNLGCTTYQDWRNFYFSSHSGFILEWWGWVYHAGSNGSWVNSIDGNSGDIN